MNYCKQISDHIRQVYFGGNWTWSNISDQLSDVTFQEATTPYGSFNSILTLICHCHFYVKVQMEVMQGLPLTSSDKDSFETPQISSESEWKALLSAYYDEAKAYADAVEKMPEEKLSQHFADPKYGTWHRNLLGLIEHTHYHLGQIALVKKMIRMEGGKR